MKIVNFILILFLGFGFLLGQEKRKCNKDVDYIEGTLFIYLESNSFDFPLESYATYISYEESNIKMDSIIINQFRQGTKIVDSKKVVKYNYGDAKSIGLSKEPKLKLNKDFISLFKKYGVYYIGRRIESFSPQDTLPHYIESRRKGRILTKRPNYNKHIIIKFTDKSNTKKFAKELHQLEGIKKVEFDQEVFEFFVPNDPNYINDQGGVDKQNYIDSDVIDFEGAWGIVKGDSDPDNIITIVIIYKDFDNINDVPEPRH